MVLIPAPLLCFYLIISLCINRKNKIKEIMFTFIAAKFITFLALGTILFNVISLIDINYIESIIKIAASIIIVSLIILNFFDYINSRAEKYGNIKLQLPKKTRKFNHRIMSLATKFIDSKILLVVVLFISIMVSLTEFMCTGQIYFISILTMIQYSNTFNLTNLTYLILYNLSLIVPLIIISLLLIHSNSIFKLTDFVREKMWIVKLINILFLAVTLSLLIVN